jgi:hypothetical protein
METTEEFISELESLDFEEMIAKFSINNDTRLRA